MAFSYLTGDSTLEDVFDWARKLVADLNKKNNPPVTSLVLYPLVVGASLPLGWTLSTLAAPTGYVYIQRTGN